MQILNREVYSDVLQAGNILNIAPDPGTTVQLKLTSLASGSSLTKNYTKNANVGPFLQEYNCKVSLLSGIKATITEETEMDFMNLDGFLAKMAFDSSTGMYSVVANEVTVVSEADVTAYGAKPDGTVIPSFAVTGTVDTGAVTSSAAVFNAATDISKVMVFHQAFSAGMAGYAMYNGIITAVAADGKSCTIYSTSCPTLASGTAIFGTDNGDYINAAVAALGLSTSRGVLKFPKGIFLAYNYKNPRSNSANTVINATRTKASPDGWYYKCVKPGVTGAAPPTFVDTYGALFTDGTVTWMCMGRNHLRPEMGTTIQGAGKARPAPYGFCTTGSVVIAAASDSYNASLLVLGNGVLGTLVKDIVFDACKFRPSAIETNDENCTLFNTAAMGGTFAAMNNSAGSTETISCHFMGRLTAGAVALQTVGDAIHRGGTAAGAGAGSANVMLKNVTDDCVLQGVHIYKGGWGLTLSTLGGPNVRMESVAAGATNGGSITGCTFDTAYGPHIELYVSGAAAAGISALAIANNQFYQPLDDFPTNTFPIIKIEATATAPAVSYSALSITGNVAKGSPAGNQQTAFIQWALNAGTQVVADSIVGNAANNCAALYTGTHTPAYTAGNVTRTTAGVVSVG